MIFINSTNVYAKHFEEFARNVKKFSNFKCMFIDRT